MKLKKLRIPLILLLLVLVVAGFIFIPKVYRGMKIQEAFEMENIEYTFINMDEYFPSKVVKKSSQPYQFPKTKNIQLPKEFEYKGTTFNTAEFLDSSFTQGLLVIQNDKIIYENYWRGQKEDTRHISWSVAKSVISALFGIAISEGHIKSIDQTVEEYLPELKGSGYEGVKIKDVLEMSTGVKFDETYSDPNSDISRWFKTFALGESQDAFAATLMREKEPGTYNHYVSINTHVLGMILVKATGKSLTEYLQEKIWQPIGTEYDAYWLADGEDMEMALGGLNATLRDYAKVGQLFLHQGKWEGKQIIPLDWVKESTSINGEHLKPNSKNSAHADIGYGYQWWIPEGKEGEFMALGVFNQCIYINPTTKTVIVRNSANQNYYDGDNPHSQTFVHLELFRKIAHMN